MLAPPPPFPQPLVSRYDEEDLQLRQDLLENEDTLRGLHARATSGDRWRKAGGRISELVFLKGSRDVAAVDIPSVDMLCEAAPNVVRLSINTPIAPSPSEPGSPLDLRYLLIDEANHAVWSANRMAATLDALYACDVPELHVRNASLATLRKCLAYLRRNASCILVDDGDLRYIKLVDRHHTHLYAGALVSNTRFLYTNQTLEAVTSLTLSDRMVKVELDELFERAFPRYLRELRVWYGAEYRPQESRERLLEYRSAGWGRCEALEHLTLTTTRPVDLIRLRGETPAPTVQRSLIRNFLHHIHGGNFTAMLKVKIIQDGVDVVDS